MVQAIAIGVQNMNLNKLNKLKDLYGEKDGRFYIAECNFVIPLWVEKFWLSKLRSKKFRHIKKRIKKELCAAIKRGMDE